MARCDFSKDWANVVLPAPTKPCSKCALVIASAIERLLHRRLPTGTAGKMSCASVCSPCNVKDLDEAFVLEEV